MRQWGRRTIAMFKICSAALLIGAFPLAGCAPAPVSRVEPVVAMDARPGGDVRVLETIWRDDARSREVPVKVYLPAGTDPAPAVIVSHGLGGSREGLAYMGRALAAHGYVAVHVQHAGSDIEAARAGPGQPMQNLAAAAGDPVVAINRFADIPFAVTELLRLNGQPGALRRRIDGDHLAILGHSFGAVTSLAIAGHAFPGGQTVRDPRIDVAVALSPSPPRRQTSSEAYGGIDIPVLMFTGTADTSPVDDFTPERRQEPFGALNRAFRMLVVFDGADHGVFGGRARGPAESTDPSIQAETARITLAFLDRFLKAQPADLAAIEAAADACLRVPGRLWSAE